MWFKNFLHVCNWIDLVLLEMLTKWLLLPHEASLNIKPQCSPKGSTFSEVLNTQIYK